VIFLAFIIIPIIEISIFITIGSNIGILNTIAIILITALLGIFLVRRQGIKLLFDAQRNLSQGIMPAEEIKGGIFLLVSGLLLITPGFFTDCIGFAVFLKPIQNFIATKAKNYFKSRIRY
tara:strand:- start:385 stop:744 length:360 start_codon:yes stop_codon:yes gene_type:complete